LLRAFSLSVELQGVDHALIPIVHHDSSPFVEWELRRAMVSQTRS
jgi:hypothetical protein